VERLNKRAGMAQAASTAASPPFFSCPLGVCHQLRAARKGRISVAPTGRPSNRQSLSFQGAIGGEMLT